MPSLGGYEVVFNRFPELEGAIREAASKAVRKAAFDIQAAAQAQAPVLTGFLKSSIYTVTHNESGYGEIQGDGPLLPEVDKPPDDQTAYVAVGAEYGIYVELGTSKMAAQPYLLPAADFVRPAFIMAMEHLEDYLKGLAALGE